MSPIEPPPTAWHLEPPPDDHPDDLWAVGADLEPATLLSAYRLGLFPMPLGPLLGWFSPPRRAIVPLEGFSPNRSLRRAARKYEIRVDTAFADVVAGLCATGRPAELDRRRRRRRVRAPARARLGALGRGVGRRRPCRWPLRRRDRRALRRRVDVLGADGCVEGGLRRARRAPCGAGDAATGCSTSSG